MKHRFLMTFILLLLAVITKAQDVREITGTVTDPAGEPLIGATVKAVGEGQGTVTDLDGHFKIKVGKNVQQLTVSYIGYDNYTATIKGNTVHITMKEANNTMEELVVVGYGSVKRGDVTNAVAQIKGEQLSDRPVSNIGSALQGELAGVEVRTTSGQPGGGVQINVRGATSINEDGTSAPLYVVDGVPMDEDFDLVSLNPQDIESIEVLKDASSSAIYGSRGANGVVIITSKKGAEDGKTRIAFKSDFSLSSPERYVDVLNPEEWIAWRTKSNDVRYVNQYGNKGATIYDDFYTRVRITGGTSSNYVNDPRWSMPNYGGLSLIDWQKELFQTALTQDYNLSVSSGTKKSNYRASVGYLAQDGIVVETNFKRLNVKLGGQTTVFDRLTIGVDVNLQLGKTKGGNVDGKDNAGMGALTMCPVAEPEAGVHTGTEPYPSYLYAGSANSPVEMMKRQSYDDERIRVIASAFLRYQINQSLTAELMGSWTFNNREFKRFTPSSLNRYWATAPEGYYTSARWNGNRSHRYLGQALLTYDHTWGKHHLNAVAGWSLEHSRDNYSYTMVATQFPNNAIEGFNMKNVQLTDVDATIVTDDKLVSFFARAEYGFDNRYLLTASLRSDGSSRFASGRRWGTFPAVSAAWRISNEKFWKPEWLINQAKLRVSYGTNGSNSIPANSAYGMMGISNYSKDGTLVTGYIPISQNNDNLRWQKTDSWNFGFDISFFRNRISLAFDYYIKNIRDMLYRVTLPAVMGYTSSYTNVGNIRNKGIEIEMKTENLTGKLRWTTNLSIGYNKNEVIDLGDNSTIFTGYDNSTQVIEVGYPAGTYYLYDAVGVYQNKEDLEIYPTQTGSVVGSVRYRDANGDGKITSADRVRMGHPQPDATFGLKNTFKYKNWDFSFLITAQTGGKIYSALGRNMDRQGMGTSGNVLKKWMNMWFSESDPGDGLTPNAWLSGINEEYDNRWLYSSDFIKLKNITLGYRFKLPKKSVVSSLRVNVSVENVFMIDSYDGGYSPESNNAVSRISSYDYGAYPQARTFSLGVNVQF